jgi:O-methyltransferase involved in polyketide biosynthesis
LQREQKVNAFTVPRQAAGFTRTDRVRWTEVPGEACLRQARIASTSRSASLCVLRDKLLSILVFPFHFLFNEAPHRAAHPGMQGHISDTAYLVNESRARALALSGDRYARHWIPSAQSKRVARLWDDFAAAVYAHDDIELAVRNRFFLDQLQEFTHAHPAAVVCNIGAGFTSYPFLLEPGVHFVEVDYPDVSAQKQRRLAELQSRNILPQRAIDFVMADLNNPDDRASLRKTLQQAMAGGPSFILMEGLSYYLPQAVMTDLGQTFSSLQTRGSLLAFDFWRPDMTQQAVFIRLQQFFSRRFGHAQLDYFLFDEVFIDTLPGYHIRVLTDVVREERRYAKVPVLIDPPAVLRENYAVLERAGA